MAGTEVLVPFTLDLTGQVATTSDPEVQSQQHVNSLVSTTPGERVMLPDYGVPLKSYLFWPGELVTAQQIVHDVKAQMARWEPGLSVTAVEPVPSDQPGLAEIDVSWEISPSAAAATRRATVHVGGTVTPL